MTVRTALAHRARNSSRTSIVGAPRLTAEVLLAHAMHRDRAWLYAHPRRELSEVGWIHFGRYLHERLKGKPTQYITVVRSFMAANFA